MARGPKLRVHLFNGYFVNEYKFHTQNLGFGKSSMNSGVCIRGSCYNDFGRDYYGMLDEIMELEYESENNKGDTLVLFKYEWYDYVKGIRVHPRYNIIDLNPKSRLATDDPFVLASQAEQVFYTEYHGYNKRERERERESNGGLCVKPKQEVLLMFPMQMCLMVLRQE